MSKKVIHVVGTGTIGEPLIGLIARMQKELDIGEVTFHKRTPLLTDRSKVWSLINRGAKLAVDAGRMADFEKLGIKPAYESEEALERATAIIDCTPSGNENKETIYKRFDDGKRGFIAQGSEFGFGKMYARGVNDRALEYGKDRFIHVVSCNTHNLACIIDTLALFDPKTGKSTPQNLEAGRFVCIRRANDLSQDEDYLPAPQVGKHKEAEYGTHHARDAASLFKTVGYDLKLYSSEMKMPSQYMHVIHFNLRLREPTTLKQLRDRIAANDRVAVTFKKSTNQVFSFGRDHGFFGRVMNQTVIPIDSLAVADGGREVVGFCFTPQDGNSLLSSLAAAQWFIDPETYEQKIQFLKPFFFSEV